MGYCKLECPDGETEYCICCEKLGGCDNRCDMMDSYEYAEDCEITLRRMILKYD